MAFIHTIPPEEATGPLAQVYAAEHQHGGVVDNGVRAFSLRPAAYVAWQNLRSSAFAPTWTRVRRYELVTIAAATSLRCSLLHAGARRSAPLQVLQRRAGGSDRADYRHAGLEPAEVAMMAYAEKIVLNAYKVTPEDIDGLRAHGFSDADILDIALTAAARSFFSKMLDAVGAEPDEKYLDLQPELRQTLTVGRPFG